MRHVYPEKGDTPAVLIVSVAPRHFNDADMTSLAAQLNKRFSKERRIKAAPLASAAVLVRRKNPVSTGATNQGR